MEVVAIILQAKNYVTSSSSPSKETPCRHEVKQVGHMEATTTTTPTSHERDDKGMGVDVTMIPLVDMMNDDCLHALDETIDVTYASFPFTCDVLPCTHIEHVDSSICDDIAIDMLCPKCLQYSPIVASKMLNNCSFKCLVCNNVEMLDNEFAPMASSLFGDFSCAHIDNHDHVFRALCNKCLNYSPIVASKMLNNCSFKCLVCNNVAMLSNEIAPIAFSPFGDFPFSMLRKFNTSLCMLPIHIFHLSHFLLVRLVMCK